MNKKKPTRARRMPFDGAREVMAAFTKQERIQVLVLISSNARTSSWLSQRLGLPVSRIRSVLRVLRNLELVETWRISNTPHYKTTGRVSVHQDGKDTVITVTASDGTDVTLELSRKVFPIV